MPMLGALGASCSSTRIKCGVIRQSATHRHDFLAGVPWLRSIGAFCNSLFFRLFFRVCSWIIMLK
jgi:hypothetical protein